MKIINRLKYFHYKFWVYVIERISSVDYKSEIDKQKNLKEYRLIMEKLKND